ncbi:hypothetical protein [Saccharopolyspora elongata]|nr:hypothetical protein [Saccharopolyspora elongata]
MRCERSGTSLWLFVSGVETDVADVAIARAMTGMGHAMGRSCVAEGVENIGQFLVLSDLGIAGSSLPARTAASWWRGRGGSGHSGSLGRSG